MESPFGSLGLSPLFETLFTKLFLLGLSTLITFVMIYFRRLVGALDTIKGSLIDLNIKLAVIVTEQKGSNEKVNDHEGRLRALEHHLSSL